MKKIVLIFILGILLVGTVSAFDYDNIKSFDDKVGDYGKIEIRNSVFGWEWFQLDKVATIELKTNTEICKDDSCSAVKEIIMFEDGKLIDKVRFIDLKIGGETRIQSYKIQYKVGGKWIDYNYGEVNGNSEGTTYEVRLTGKLKSFQKVDWQIKTQGIWLGEFAVWDAGLNIDILAYWNFNEGTGTNIEDVTENGNNGTWSGIVNWTIGVLGNSVQFNDSPNMIIEMNQTNLFNRVNQTINIWVNNTAIRTDEERGVYADNTGKYAATFHDTDGLRVTAGGTLIFAQDNTAWYNQNEWQMITILMESENNTLYVDGVHINSSVTAFTPISVTNFSVGGVRGGPSNYVGRIDEMGIWERKLTGTEITQLYNSGIGISFIDAAPTIEATVTLNSPANNTREIAGATFTFNASVSPRFIGNVTNATLNIWNSSIDLIISTTNVLSGNVTNDTFFSETLDDAGIYIWNVFGCISNVSVSNCSFATNNRTINITNLRINDQTYSNSTTEGNTEEFSINFTVGSSTTVATVNLIYNGTLYNADLSNPTGDDYFANRDITIPSVDASINLSFFWNILFTEGDPFNTSITNQSISSINIDDCSVNTVRVLNLTLVDEESQDILVPTSPNTTIDLALNLYNLEKTLLIVNFSTSFNNTNPVEVCLNINLTSQANYLLDAIIRYEAGDHAVESYNLVDFSLTNETIPESITLYDLLSADSTDFQLTFKGADFIAVENALVFLKRQYVAEDLFKTVELPKTDANGQTVLHMVRNDVIYTIEVIKDGVVLGLFDNIVAFCDDVLIGDCKINLNAFITGEEIFDYDATLGLIFTSFIFDNNTREISFDYSTTDGSSKTVNLDVTRNDIFGNTSVCNSSLTSAGGTLKCTVPSHIEDSIINVKVLVDNEEVIRTSIVLEFKGYGNMGYFIFFIMILSFILQFSNSKSGILIGILLGFVAGISLGLIKGAMVGVNTVGIWLILVVIIMIWKLNKTRSN